MKNIEWLSDWSWIDTRDTDGMAKLNSEAQCFERCAFEVFTVPSLSRIISTLRRKEKKNTKEKPDSPRLHGAVAVDVPTDSSRDIPAVQ